MNQQPFVPEWAKHVVWYQIFPERFWNGHPTMTPGWQTHPWTADWNRQLPYKNHDEGLWIALRQRRADDLLRRRSGNVGGQRPLLPQANAVAGTRF